MPWRRYTPKRGGDALPLCCHRAASHSDDHWHSARRRSDPRYAHAMTTRPDAATAVALRLPEFATEPRPSAATTLRDEGGLVLLLLSGPDAGRQYPIREGGTTIGRASEADFRLDDATVSRLHCRIIREADSYAVQDLSSTNGTFVDQQPVSLAPLHCDCQLLVGASLLTLVAAGTAAVQDDADGRQLTRQDLLCGLADRLCLQRELDRLEPLATQATRTLAVLAIELDRFQSLVDAHGQLAGAAVLRAVVTLLEQLLPDQAIAARVGGGEFAIVLADAGAEEADALTALLRARIAALRIVHAGETFAVTISIGQAQGLQADFGALLQQADQRLREARTYARQRRRGEADPAPGTPD